MNPNHAIITENTHTHSSNRDSENLIQNREFPDHYVTETQRNNHHGRDLSHEEEKSILYHSPVSG